MDGSPESHHPHEGLTRRAEELAVDAEKRVPSWLRAGDPESAFPVLVAVLSAVALQVAIPKSLTLVPRWPLLVMEVLLLIVLLVINPLIMSRRTTMGRYATWVLLAAITVDNTLSAVMLDVRIITGEVSNKAEVLLGSGRRSSSRTSSCSASGTGSSTAAARSPGTPESGRIPISCSRR